MLNSIFVLGPHIVRASTRRKIDSQVEDTGLQVEFATSEAVHRLSIHHCIPYEQHPLDFASLFVREDDLPFEISCWNSQRNCYTGGPYVALTAFLAELYKRFSRLIPPKPFLEIYSIAYQFADHGVPVQMVQNTR